MNEIDICGIVTTAQEFSIRYRGVSNSVNNCRYSNIAHYSESNMYECVEMSTGDYSEVYNRLVKWNPELIIVVGWYYMIPDKLRTAPKLGTIGMHASLLPSYRGGAPLVWAIINGEKQTGISLFYFDDGVDTGDIISQKATPISDIDTIETLYRRIEDLGIEMLLEELPKIGSGQSKRVHQSALEHTASSFAQRNPSDGEIDWSRTSNELNNFIRAQTIPYPCAYSMLNGKMVRFIRGRIINSDCENFSTLPGTIIRTVMDGIIQVSTGDGVLEVTYITADSEVAEVQNKIVTGARFENESVL